MAEEQYQKPATEEVVVETSTTEKEPPVPEPEPEAGKPGPVQEVVEEPEKPKAEEVKITESVSFKEESYVVGELPEAQRKALEELRQLVQEALNKHEFTAPPPPPKEEEKKEEKKQEEEEKAPPKVDGVCMGVLSCEVDRVSCRWWGCAQNHVVGCPRWFGVVLGVEGATKWWSGMRGSQ
ncbi:patellin-2-like [Corylus avellana]|uniref:patellin-2-like n=1 Tax=Corylus avellana TaxID=13451 RepID=UPI00286BBAC1|nr:patellin-2-like [Corylus avellana]